jgi:hypothetical protein
MDKEKELLLSPASAGTTGYINTLYLIKGFHPVKNLPEVSA